MPHYHGKITLSRDGKVIGEITELPQPKALTLSDRLTLQMTHSMTKAHRAYQQGDGVRLRRYAIEAQGWEEVEKLTRPVKFRYRKCLECGRLEFYE